MREHNERLEVAASAARQLARRQDTGVKERLEAVRFPVLHKASMLLKHAAGQAALP